MNFCIATIEYWQSIGFDCTNWRKSIDGTKAIIHAEYAKVLVDIDNNTNIEVYIYPSEELEALLNSSEWTEIEMIEGEEGWLSSEMD